ncbi:MAG TPA: hypothetical protein VE914_13660 [Candidatus Angelobacter sp.]|nr:hypothetical protein [Candidatus Angelobacter sp.]
MRHGRAGWARLLGGAIALLALFGCASGSDSDAGFAKVCAAQGLTPGSDGFATCVERQRQQQLMDLERIRQAREAARGGTKL